MELKNKTIVFIISDEKHLMPSEKHLKPNVEMIFKNYHPVKEKHPKINLIINEKNLGYCGGNNIGIKSAKGKFIIILNPDTVVDPNWITEFLKSYKQFGDAIYQPKFLSMDDHKMLLSSGQMINLFGFGFSRGKGTFEKKEDEKEEIKTTSEKSFNLKQTNKKLLYAIVIVVVLLAIYLFK